MVDQTHPILASGKLVLQKIHIPSVQPLGFDLLHCKLIRYLTRITPALKMPQDFYNCLESSPIIQIIFASFGKLVAGALNIV